MVAKKKSAEDKKSGGTVKVKWVVSFISCTDDMRQTIRGLGLRRMHQVVEREDTPSVRGMIHKVRHLVEVVEQGKWQKKFPRVARRARKPAAAASRRASRPRARLLWRVYRICARRGVRGIAKCASAEV